MTKIKKWFRAILYVLGAVIIITGVIMGLLSLLSPLATYSIQLHDLMLLLFAVLVICWIVYVMWNAKRLKNLCENESLRITDFEDIISIGEKATLIVTTVTLLFAITITVTVLENSFLTFFLSALVSVLSFIIIIILLESKLHIRISCHSKMN